MMLIKNLHKNEKGLSRILWLLIILFLIVGVYVGINLFAPYFHFWMMQDAVTETARHFAKVKPKNDSEVIQKVLDEARNQELSLDKDGVTYTETEGKLYLAAEWSEKVELLYYSHEFQFRAEALEQLLR